MKEKLSVCCNASLIGGVQCEVCGADGRKFEAEEMERRAGEFRQEEKAREEKEKLDNN